MAKHRADPSSNRFVGLAARIDADVIADEERARLAPMVVTKSHLRDADCRSFAAHQ
jgi:hypothetical protein